MASAPSCGFLSPRGQKKTPPPGLGSCGVAAHLISLSDLSGSVSRRTVVMITRDLPLSRGAGDLVGTPGEPAGFIGRDQQERRVSQGLFLEQAGQGVPVHVRSDG